MEKWVVMAKKADFNQIGKTHQISPILARLLVNRDLKTDDEIHRYLHGSARDMYQPGSMKDIVKAALMIEQAIKAETKIVIASDFDVDGIFSSFILLTGFTRLGAEARIDTPNRVTEGYGLNNRIVEEASEQGAGLIVTCDNGIAAFEAVSRAKELGMKVIVTDHHDIPFRVLDDGERETILPEADAIVNPKQEDCQYPFKKLCGAGVAYKLVQVLYERARVSEEELHSLLEYTAVATVADVMDLQDENRIIVKEGLDRLRRTTNHGLAALIDINSLDRDKISAYHIGFVIGPCFNAAGRLDTVKMALDLLMAKSREEAMVMAADLKTLNESRKDLTVEGFKKAVEIIENSTIKDDKILLVLLEDCHESLVGIIAGRVKEKYHKPTLVFSCVEDGLIKGSGRSIEAYNMFEGLTACKPLLARFGGHPMAAGLSLKAENLPALREQLNRETTLTEEELTPVVKIDIPMPVSYVSEPVVNELDLLEPFGKGNPKPLFAEKNLSVIRASVLGKNRNVIKMKVRNEAGTLIDALHFGDVEAFESYITEYFGADQLSRLYTGDRNEVQLAFTYYPGINEFRGQKTLQIVVQSYQYLQ